MLGRPEASKKLDARLQKLVAVVFALVPCGARLVLLGSGAVHGALGPGSQRADGVAFVTA